MRIVVRNPTVRRACECPAPGLSSSRPRIVRDTRERTAPRYPRDTEQVTLVGKPGAKCRPFLTVQKDPERFAACNALADEIGEFDEPKKAFRLIEDAIGDEVNEVFGIVLLDIHLRFKGLAETGRGEPSSVMAPLKPTLQMALMGGAESIILFHVHPSGIKAEPSDADIETTEAYVAACETIELKLLDHIILGGSSRNLSYFSFLEDGLL